MIKLFFKLIGLLLMIATISLATILFVPEEITSNVKNWGNSVFEQSSQETPTELPDSGTENKTE